MDKIYLKALMEHMLVLGVWFLVCCVLATVITLIYINWYKIEKKLGKFDKFIEKHDWIL